MTTLQCRHLTWEAVRWVSEETFSSGNFEAAAAWFISRYTAHPTRTGRRNSVGQNSLSVPVTATLPPTHCRSSFEGWSRRLTLLIPRNPAVLYQTGHYKYRWKRYSCLQWYSNLKILPSAIIPNLLLFLAFLTRVIRNILFSTSSIHDVSLGEK